MAIVVRRYGLTPTRAGFVTECVECGRVFDLLDETDAEELAYGHDCETEGGSR